MGATKKAKVTFTCEYTVKDYLNSWADDENRTMSNLVETLVEEAIALRQEHKPLVAAKPNENLPPSPTEAKDNTKVTKLQLDKETKSAAPQTFTELVRANYFDLMNKGKINPTRLKELSFGQKPNAGELTIIAKVLDISEELVTELHDRTFKKGVS